MTTFVAVLRGPDHIFEFVSDAHRKAFGDRDVIGKARADVYDELNDQGFAAAPRKAFDTGQTVLMRDKPARFDHMPDGLARKRILDISYEPMRDRSGKVTGLFVSGRDLTLAPGHALQDRAATYGLEALSDVELLSVSLFNGTGDPDSNERAHHLMQRFGGLGAVLTASLPSLGQIVPRHLASLANTLPPSTALHLKIIREMGRRIILGRLAAQPVVSSSRTLRAYVHGLLANEPREKFVVLFLDRSCRLIACETLWEGTVGHTPVYVREVLRRAIELSAVNLILVHNHPARDSRFSASDVATTDAIETAARPLDIEVIDHLLVAGDEVVSFREVRRRERQSRRRSSGAL